jgi:PAS domain S-box-containing protein
MKTDLKHLKPQRKMAESIFLRYGVAVVVSLIALLLSSRLPIALDINLLICFGAVTISALYQGFGPGVLTSILCAAGVKLFFMPPVLNLFTDVTDVARLCAFMMLSLMSTGLIAGSRTKKNGLLESEERYRLLAETASEGIFLFDQRGLILFVNSFAARTFGYSVSEMIGQNLSLIIPEDVYSSQITQLKEHLDTRSKSALIQLTTRKVEGAGVPLEVAFASCNIKGKSLFSAFIRNTGSRSNGAPSNGAPSY